MIWFNDKEFFDWKLDINGSKYISNRGVLSSILKGGDLDYLNQVLKVSQADDLKDKIIRAKQTFDKDFYFVYSSIDSKNDIIIQNESDKELVNLFENYLVNKQYMNGRKNGSGKSFCEKIEKITKSKLKEINIETGAKAHGEILNAKIDLSSIQSCLINLNNHNFNDAGNYIKSLII